MSLLMWKFFYIVHLCYVVMIIITTARAYNSPCNLATHCGACIRIDSECHWCSDVNYTAGKHVRRSRCSRKEDHVQHGCHDIVYLQSTHTENGEAFSDNVQVSPQQLNLDLRIGDPIEFKLSVKPAKDFPVDLYYLMDVSASMADDLKNLKQLANKIATEIQKITKNYRFGFGSFVDKNIPPFTQPQDPTFPCNNLNKDGEFSCRPTFGFIHFFEFSRNVSQFEEVVSKQKISGDSDSPEGGFDALMQVAVCDEELRWRRKRETRKIVIFVTDAYPKIAGDGKIGGIVVPNDGKCHMRKISTRDGDIETYYDKSTELDYPSIHFLRKKMRENEIVPIIAVTKEVIHIYKEIAESWKDLGAEVDILSSDSSNIVHLIRKNYRKISSTVRLTDNAPNLLKVHYEVDGASCTHGSKHDKSNECSNILLEEKVDFKVKVMATSCPRDDDTYSRSFKIRTSGFGEVRIKLNYLCDCPCEIHGQENSQHCNTSGTLKCGICDCNSERLGSNCECDASNPIAAETETCIENDDEGNELCSGFGNCVCGKCECFKSSEDNDHHHIYGKYCQCKDYGCDKFNGLECGGVTRGKCECGKCRCREEFVGSNCGQTNCNVTEERHCLSNVVSSSTPVICSNNGHCDCEFGGCVCNSGYVGQHCEECFTNRCMCSSVEHCITCLKSDKEKSECAHECDGYYIIETNNTEHSCSLVTPQRCLVYYSVNVTIGHNATIYIQQYSVCPLVEGDEDIDILVIVFSTIGGIVLLGLLMVLSWKLLITMYDKREYERFRVSQYKSAWKDEDNPVYRPPNQVYDNPAFTGRR